MSMEKINAAKAEIAATSAYQIITEFFDADSFCEIDAFAKSGEGFAEVVAGYGTVEGMPVYAFAQNSDICGGAMSKAQAAKLRKLYSLALKTGAPVAGFYDSVGGRLTQGTELLAGTGELLRLASKLSGAVPQISVVLGTCLGTNALNAASADIVLMTEDAQLSLDVTGKNADAQYNASHGNAAVIVKDKTEAVEKARELVTYLPSNNLVPAPQAEDAGSKLRLSDAYGDNARTTLARLGGQVVGVVRTTGGKLDCQSAAKAAKFVRFCDAFSIPVIEATTVKLSVVVGEAIGSAYVALAGTGANADVVYALPEAVISPVNIEAAAFILAPDAMKVPASEQQAAAAAFAQENLSAFNAAQNGYVDGIVPFEELRGALLSALDMLSGKRVPTVAKKHCTI